MISSVSASQDAPPAHCVPCSQSATLDAFLADKERSNSGPKLLSSVNCIPAGDGCFPGDWRCDIVTVTTLTTNITQVNTNISRRRDNFNKAGARDHREGGPH